MFSDVGINFKYILVLCRKVEFPKIKLPNQFFFQTDIKSQKRVKLFKPARTEWLRSGGFWFSFPFIKQNSIDFADYIKIQWPFDLARSPICVWVVSWGIIISVSLEYKHLRLNWLMLEYHC